MKILVCGSRHWRAYSPIRRELEKFVDQGEVTIIHGAATGADTLAGKVAKELKFIEVAIPADWKKYGRAAGPIRNKEMLTHNPDLVIAFHPRIEESKGTKHMVKIAREAGVTVEVHGW